MANTTSWKNVEIIERGWDDREAFDSYITMMREKYTEEMDFDVLGLLLIFEAALDDLEDISIENDELRARIRRDSIFNG